MASANFTYQDAVDQARELLDDDAQRRWSDADINLRYVPRVLQQMRTDRPDAFLDVLTTLNPKPAIDAACAFSDVIFPAFVEALVAAIHGSQEETASGGQAALADSRAERNKGR